MKNLDIAAMFYEIADILDIQDVKWKPRAYRQAARAIETLSVPIEDIYKKGGLKAIEELPGVGEGIGKKIEEYIKTGKMKKYEEVKASVPPHISLMMKIPGIGPKKVKKLNKELNIKSTEDLEKAAKQHRIADIPGFGEKSEREILEGIELVRQTKERIPLKKAEAAAKKIIDSLKVLKEVQNISAAGSLRRKKETVGDIDILIASEKPEKVIDAFTGMKSVKKVLGKGQTKASVILKNGIQSDLRVLKPESWGSGLLYFTGSKNYNIEMRKIAIKKGMRLSEYGLFDKQTGKMIAGKTEEEVCKKLGVKWVRPEEREM
jgi:DNA polymerase (family 10)